MPRTERTRLQRRLIKHHLPLFVLSIFCFAALYLTRPYTDVLSRASFATAYPALGLLAATLLLGPWNVLRRLHSPVSSDLRRDIGIWAGMLGILHSAIGQCVHLRGRPWLYYVYGANEHRGFPLRHDLFGLANYTGAVSVLLLIVLLAMSNDYSLRTLGARRWKQFQRWNYAVIALAAIHAIAYFAIEKQKLPFVTAVVICLVITCTLQVAGVAKRRSLAAHRS